MTEDHKPLQKTAFCLQHWDAMPTYSPKKSRECKSWCLLMHAAVTYWEQLIHYFELWARILGLPQEWILLGGPAVIADRVLKPFSNGITREYMNDLCTMLCENVDWMGRRQKVQYFPFHWTDCLLSTLHSKELATHWEQGMVKERSAWPAISVWLTTFSLEKFGMVADAVEVTRGSSNAIWRARSSHKSWMPALGLRNHLV